MTSDNSSERAGGEGKCHPSVRREALVRTGVTYTETGFQLYGCENHRQSLRLKSQSSLDAVSMLLAFSDFVFYFFVV